MNRRDAADPGCAPNDLFGDALAAGVVFAAATVGTVLEIALQRHAGIDAGDSMMVVFSMSVATVGCAYIVIRTRRLVADVAVEQVRRERLARYFSPHVAALVAA